MQSIQKIMIGSFAAPERKPHSIKKRHKLLAHYMITGKLLQFPKDVKEEVEAVIAEMAEKGKKPRGEVRFY